MVDSRPTDRIAELERELLEARAARRPDGGDIDAKVAELTRSRDSWEADYKVMFQNNEDRKAGIAELKLEVGAKSDLAKLNHRTACTAIAANTDLREELRIALLKRVSE